MTRTRNSKNTLVTLRHDAVYLARLNPRVDYWKPTKHAHSSMQGYVTYMMLDLLGQTMTKGSLKDIVTKFVEEAPSSGTRGGTRFDISAERIINFMIHEGLIVVH